MVLQLEDCVDALKTMYPKFDFLFLFDHSCGHDKQRPDGLGPYHRTLNAGDTQYFVFQSPSFAGKELWQQVH